MRKNLLLTVSLLSSLATAAPALALQTNGRTYSVEFDGAKAGTWQLRNLVTETTNTCRYTVKWSDLAGPPLSRTTLCKIDEFKAGDDFDCEVSRMGFIDSIVSKAPGTCKGFDDFGQQTTISYMVGGESAATQSIYGVIITASVGDVQNLVVH